MLRSILKSKTANITLLCKVTNITVADFNIKLFTRKVCFELSFLNLFWIVPSFSISPGLIPLRWSLKRINWYLFSYLWLIPFTAQGFICLPFCLSKCNSGHLVNFYLSYSTNYSSHVYKQQFEISDTRQLTRVIISVKKDHLASLNGFQKPVKNDHVIKFEIQYDAYWIILS